LEIAKLSIASIFGLAGLICTIIILVDAFRDEIWKGFAGLLCGFYLFWYGIFEFEHDNKWLIVLLAIGGDAICYGILRL
jgi:hypothetical protein